MKILIAYKNGTSDEFDEKQIDAFDLTIKGHAAKMIKAWKELSAQVYLLDGYNAVTLDEVISIRVI